MIIDFVDTKMELLSKGIKKRRSQDRLPLICSYFVTLELFSYEKLVLLNLLIAKYMFHDQGLKSQNHEL